MPLKPLWTLTVNSVPTSGGCCGPPRRGREGGFCAGQGQLLWLPSGSPAPCPAPLAGFHLLGSAVRCFLTDGPEEGQRKLEQLNKSGPRTTGPVVLKWGQFCSPGDICQCLETFGCHNLEGRCDWHLVSRRRETAKHPTAYRTAPSPTPPTKDDPVGNVRPRNRALAQFYSEGNRGTEG